MNNTEIFGNIANDTIKDKLDIFICTHINFKINIPNNNVYKIIADTTTELCQEAPIITENLNKENINNLLVLFSEGSRIYYIWKNYDIKDYIGFCHYRRYFLLSLYLNDIDNIFDEYDIITRPFIRFKEGLYNQYNKDHNIKDLDLCINIIKEKFPNYNINILNNSIFIPCNMFIMKKDDFYKYCNFIFFILLEYCKIMNFNVMNDVDEYINHNEENYYHSTNEKYNKLSYQRRICGFLMERLTTLWILNNYNINKIKQIDWVLIKK